MRYAIGIDLGGTNIAAGIVTEDYKLLEKGSVPTKAQRPWQEVAADMARLAMELVEKAGLSRADCAGIGVGSPGICNGDTGEVVYSNNLYWDDVPLCPTLTRLTGLPCRLSNDANCAALGEVVAGAAKGCKTAVLLTLGTGVGGGVVIDGKIYEGRPARAQSWATARSSPGRGMHLWAQGLHQAMPPPRLSSARLQRLRPRILKAF
ncbi:MAG: ROK family protein [Ruthenibacterium lactatiformans]